MSVRDFLYMGGYAAYVWPSYLFTAAAVGWMAIAARRAHRNALETARKRIAMAQSSS